MPSSQPSWSASVASPLQRWAAILASMARYLAHRCTIIKGRAKALGELVRDAPGVTRAEIRVTLRNEGPDAYCPEGVTFRK